MVAVVHMPEGSEPAQVSVRPKLPAAYSPEQIFGMYAFFCSSLPMAWMTSQTMLFTDTVTAVDEQARAISVMATLKAMTPASEPP